MPFLGLTVVDFISRHLLGSKVVFFMFLEITSHYPHDLDQFWSNYLHISHYPHDLDRFWSNSLHITLQATLVVNNLDFICINNMFLVGFDPRILVLNRNLF